MLPPAHPPDEPLPVPVPVPGPDLIFSSALSGSAVVKFSRFHLREVGVTLSSLDRAEQKSPLVLQCIVDLLFFSLLLSSVCPPFCSFLHHVFLSRRRKKDSLESRTRTFHSSLNPYWGMFDMWNGSALFHGQT